MRGFFQWLFLMIFLYAVIGTVFWWQWHSGVSNTHLVSFPDDLNTYFFVLLRWPTIVL